MCFIIVATSTLLTWVQLLQDGNQQHVFVWNLNFIGQLLLRFAAATNVWEQISKKKHHNGCQMEEADRCSTAGSFSA